jgi:hypothetical protein
MRAENWPDLLAAYLTEAAARGFVWGENDCVLFGSNWVRRLTGLDPVADLRGSWDSETSAARVIAGQGGELEKLAGERLAGLGFSRVRPIAAMRGDIAAATISGNFTIGIVADTRACFLTMTPKVPFVFLKPKQCLAAWRIE